MNELEPIKWDFFVDYYARKFLHEINHESKQETISKILDIISNDQQIYREFILFLILEITQLVFKEGESGRARERFLSDMN